LSYVTGSGYAKRGRAPQRMTDFLRRVSLFCAIALTIALLVASVTPSAGQAFGGFHRRAHLISFAVLAFAWRWALPRVPASMVALGVIGFAFLHEAIEIFGHAHPYEMEDVAIDASGALTGLILAQLAKKIASIKQR
jgi:peptidoglycan/LPS O-acetylase OafA/YrhL